MYPSNGNLFRTDLTNGITVWYGSDASGSLILQYPNGVQVRTTWSRLALIESAINGLRDAYEYLLLRAGGDTDDVGPPVDKLVQLDDLLFALNGKAAPASPSRDDPSLRLKKSSPVF